MTTIEHTVYSRFDEGAPAQQALLSQNPKRHQSSSGAPATDDRHQPAVVPNWLGAAVRSLKNQQPLVLISVIQAKGSTPRDCGARMWVDAGGPHETIGGGHLELQAIDAATHMLEDATGSAVQVLHFALGPSLGQCCGGAVWLSLERLDQQDLPWLLELKKGLQAGLSMQRRRLIGGPDASSSSAASAVQIEEVNGHGAAAAYWDEATGVLTDTFAQHRLPIVLCGAGHVGRAIIKVLADLPVQVYWLDPRDNEWPHEIPPNVICVEGDADEVPDLPDDAYWLVLTHSHALDMEIIENVFRHKDFRFLGLIGSKTKRARFRSRLAQRFPTDLVDRMVCPIGLVETSSKLPAVIAVSVVAQLLPLIGSENGRDG